MKYLGFLLLPAVAILAPAQTSGRLNPSVQKIVSEISAERIGGSMNKLESFGSRHILSGDMGSDKGIDAARQWIFDQFHSFSPRLEVSFDSWKIRKQGRAVRDTEISNVVAVLRGTTYPDEQIIVGGHYDSLNLVAKPGKENFRTSFEGGTGDVDFEKSALAPAPGAGDNASGTAVMLELARVMSQYRFAKTIVFIAFTGEEMGLFGSTLYADRAKAEGRHIEAMLNNDIVGNDDDGSGKRESGAVRVFSDDPSDSVSRELARYIRETAQRYLPGFRADLVFRGDRFNRGGDHTPFSADGFAAVRFTTPAENLLVQHTAEDTFEKTSPPYAADVARMNAAAIGSIAVAPVAPVATRSSTSGTYKGNMVPNAGRGDRLTDTVLRWTDASAAPSPAGYRILIRATTAPYWERAISVGRVNEYVLKSVSLDDTAIGIRAVDAEGNESLTAAFVAVPYPRLPVQLR